MRHMAARRIPVPEDTHILTYIIVGLGSAALSGVGVMVAGWFRAESDNKKVRVDDRADFLHSVMARLSEVEEAAVEERRFCEERLAQQKAMFESRLDARDKMIIELQKRIAHLESLTDKGGSDV